MKKSSHSVLGENIRTLVYAVLIALGIRTFFYEPFNIPSGSMKPTLYIGDFLFVSKYAYGYSRYSLPGGFDLFEGRIMEALPERGDIAVFKYPRDNATDYIKRIIGLPGDRIQVQRGVLYINDRPVPRERIEDFIDPEEGTRIAQYVETLPNGVRYHTLDVTSQGEVDDTPVYTVPPGHLFAMGDNRDNSIDSRYLGQVGFVPVVNLVGRAEVIFFSVGSDARWWQVWRWPTALRFERFFDGLS